MLPFAESLGIVADEFVNLRNLFGTQQPSVILVEGDIDKEYFDVFKERYPHLYAIPQEVEILPYGGKDALKNTAILQFMVNKFSKVYITFDLDADSDVSRSLERIGLTRTKDFCAIGVEEPGSECIEGLLPQETKRAVYSQHVEKVTALQSQDTNVRRSAKASLKAAFLEHFKNSTYNDCDLVLFRDLFRQISCRFAQ